MWANIYEMKIDQVFFQTRLPMKQSQIGKRSARLSQVVGLLIWRSMKYALENKYLFIWESDDSRILVDDIIIREERVQNLSELMTLGN